jgi:hypothetical protein
MSRWLLDQPRLYLPTSALELGCGMGLVSLTAAHLGLLIEGTDRQEIAVDFSARSATRNALSGFRSTQLEWSTRGPEHLASQLLLASDVLYTLKAAEPLFELLQTSGLLGARRNAGARRAEGAPRAGRPLRRTLESARVPTPPRPTRRGMGRRRPPHRRAHAESARLSHGARALEDQTRGLDGLTEAQVLGDHSLTSLAASGKYFASQAMLRC